jgi:hypothetical protein
MKLNLSLLVLGLLAAPLQAATEITGDIPVELAKALLGMAPGQDVKIFSDLPDGFPLPELPADMSLVASLDQVYTQRVLVRSGIGAVAGREALMHMLSDAGWKAWEPPQLRGPQNGFVADQQFTMPDRFCKEGSDMLQFSEARMGQETLFQFSYNQLPAGAVGPCSQDMAGPFGRSVNGPALQQYIPRLELAAAMTTQGRGLQPSGSGGSSSYFENSAAVATDLGLTPLFEHFVQQIEAQGWEADARTVGASVANGIWRKQPETDLDLAGILTVIHSDDDNYHLQFRVQRLGVAPNDVMGIRSFGR